MSSIYRLKPRFQAWLRPLCRRLALGGVTPNQVTLAALVLSLAQGGWIGASGGAPAALLLLPGTLFLRMALNALDGMLAREHAMRSRLGALSNELADVAADAALYLPFALVPGVSPALAVAVVVVGIIAEMAGAIAPQIGASRRYEGPFGKSDRAFGFGALGLFLGLGWIGAGAANLALGLMLFLGLVTIGRRMRAALLETTPGG